MRGGGPPNFPGDKGRRLSRPIRKGRHALPLGGPEKKKKGKTFLSATKKEKGGITTILIPKPREKKWTIRSVKKVRLKRRRKKGCPLVRGGERERCSFLLRQEKRENRWILKKSRTRHLDSEMKKGGKGKSEFIFLYHRTKGEKDCPIATREGKSME